MKIVRIKTNNIFFKTLLKTALASLLQRKSARTDKKNEVRT